jgi:signal transduction histidine kinase
MGSSTSRQRDAVREEVAAELFPFVRVLYGAGLALALGVAVFTEPGSGRGSPSLWFQLAVGSLTIAGAWLPLGRAWNVTSVLAGLFAVTIAGLLRYGPLGGIGLVLVGAAFTAAIFHGPRRAIAAGVLAAACFGGAAFAIVLGLVPAPAPEAHDPSLATTWIRTGATISVVAVALVALFERLMAKLEQLADRIARSRLQLEAAEGERERALAALANGQRLGALGQLAAGAAHDFRNALTIIQASAAGLRAAGNQEGVAGALADIEQVAQAASETARQLLVFGRPDAGGEERCLPAAVAAEVARTLARVLPPGIEVRTRTIPSGPVGMGEGTLGQALLNLALNARDAMPDGGSLLLAVAPDPAGGGATIEVADTGRGMDPATLARATEPFFTTKPAGAGTGLGLAMVRDVAARAGGSVEIHSTPERGTTVRLRLPAAPSGSPAGREGAVASRERGAGPG